MISEKNEAVLHGLIGVSVRHPVLEMGPLVMRAQVKRLRRTGGTLESGPPLRAGEEAS